MALATLIAAFGSEYGLDLAEDKVLWIIGIGIALILGIAHEDNGTKSGIPAMHVAQEALSRAKNASIAADVANRKADNIANGGDKQTKQPNHGKKK